MCKLTIKRIIVLSGLLFQLFFTSFGQTKRTEHLEQVWLAYINQVRLSEKWGVGVDLHLRSKDDFLSGLSVGIIRGGLTHYLTENLRFTVAYAYVNIYPGDNHKNISQPEHRPWQQVQWISRSPGLRITQYLRLEERWRRKILNDDALAHGFNFNFRLRYSFAAQIPLGPKKFQPGSFSLVLIDEPMVNFGKQIVYNYFDQNRFFAGINYQLNAQNNLQAGFSNVFQQLSSGNVYRNINAIRLSWLQNMDLRDKDRN